MSFGIQNIWEIMSEQADRVSLNLGRCELTQNTAPACHSPPISTLNLMRPTLRICGAQPDMVQRRPRGQFRILDEEATQ